MSFFYQSVLVVEEKELLDLLSNFLIEISGSIFTASFKFRRPADSSFLLEQHGGRQYPPPSPPPGTPKVIPHEMRPSHATIKKSHSILNLT
jgi:hypothetical protein